MCLKIQRAKPERKTEDISKNESSVSQLKGKVGMTSETQWEPLAPGRRGENCPAELEAEGMSAAIVTRAGLPTRRGGGS